jgi:hypothetical protein
MRLELISWDGHNINDEVNYVAGISPGNSMPSASAIFVDLGKSFPVLTGKTLSGGYITISIVLRGNIEAQRDELNKWFSVRDFEAKTLLAKDLDDSDREWYLTGFPVTAPMLENGTVAKCTVTLALASPYWMESVEQSTVWTVENDTETQVITSRGNAFALPIFEVDPTVIKNSNTLASRTFIGIRNSGWGYTVIGGIGIIARTTIPIDLTPLGVDTQTPIAGGNMNSSGNDVVVTVDGAPVYRWFTGINTLTTHIWANISMIPAPTLVLKTTLDSSTLPDTIVCSFTEASISLPQNSTFQIGTEFFTYSTYSVDNTLKEITFTMVSRGAKESTKAAHSVGAAVYWIEHDIWITYGDPSAPAPTQDETQKPSMNLSLSSNDEWVWDTFSTMPANAGFNSPHFTGAAKKFTDEDNVSGMVSPYEVLGIELESVQSGNNVVQYNLSGAITVSHPGKISRLICNIEKWRSGSVHGTLTLFAGDTVEVSASPSATGTWEAEAIDITSLSPNFNAGIDFRGILGTTLPVPQARVQAFDMTVEINTPPEVTVISAVTAYKLSPIIENETTGYGFQLLDIATKLTEVTTVDCLEMETYKEDGTRVRGQLAFTGGSRDEWMTLEPGSNTLRFTDTGTDGVQVTIRHRGRNTL